jgi:glutamate synthase (NADPH/NADH) small chain
VDYLTETTRSLLEKRESAISARGKHVVVVGGGDTGNDCVGSVLRQECAQVTELELMPQAPGIRPANNPWPEWPRTLRTDYGQLEAAWKQGADPRIFETTVKEIKTDEAGRIRAVETVRVCRMEKGFEQIPGTEREIPCELLLIAAGFTGCETKTASIFHANPDPRGRLMPEDGSHHLSGKLFSAGDMRTGQSLVVRALADGRAAAEEVNQYLASML